MLSFLRAALCVATVFIILPDRAAASFATPGIGRIPPAIVGLVRDSAGIPVSNARVVVERSTRVAITDLSGAFRLSGLPPGRYHLDVMRIGYAKAEAEVEIGESGDDVRVVIVMHQTAVRLSNVVVSAKPTGGDALGITQSTVDLSGKELAASLSASIAQTLEREPGMSARYNGPAATLPVIRGLTGERILVLQDGERSGDLSAASPDHGLTIDPLSADRIEVVRGPASLLYGTAALGGVVNVISSDVPTTVPTRVTGYVAGQGESVRPGGALSGGASIPLSENAVLSLAGGLRGAKNVYMGGGDRLLNSDASDNHQSVGLVFIGDRGAAGTSYRRYDFRYGLPGTAGDDKLGIKIDGLRNVFGLRGELTGVSRTLPSLNVTGTVQTYEHEEIENSGEVGTSFNLKTQTGSMSAKTVFGRAEGAIGLSALLKQYSATGEEALTPAADSKGAGIFVFQEFPLASASEHSATLQLGARYDIYRIASREGDPKFGPPRTAEFNTASGSVGLTIPAGPSGSLAVNAARAFRAPTVEELFSNAMHAATGTFDVGNPDLDAETNTGVESVFRIQTRKTNGQVAAYYNRITNFIVPDLSRDTIVDGETVPLNRFSQVDATLRGAEASIEGEVMPHVVIGGSGDFVRATLAGGGNVPFIPPARLGVHGRWDNGRLTVGADIRHGFKQDKVSGTTIDVPTESYTLVNVSVGWSAIFGSRVHTLVLRADNLTDSAYRDATSWIKSFAFNPGRNFAVVYKTLF